MINENELHPEVLKRWKSSKDRYAKAYPNAPQPFLTQCHRSVQEQNDLYDQGRTKPGKIVTRAIGGKSVHNYKPSCAFDIAFKLKGQVLWDEPLFEQFAVIAKSEGLEWGGDWKTFKDRPHFQAPNYTWRDAEAGREPVFATPPSLPLPKGGGQ